MDTLTRLSKAASRLAADLAERDQLIAQARAEGHSLRTVAAAAGISHVAIAKKER